MFICTPKSFRHSSFPVTSYAYSPRDPKNANRREPSVTGEFDAKLP